MLQKFVHPQLWHAHQAAYLVHFLDCAQKSIRLHSSWLQWLFIYQSFSPLKLAALNNLHDLKLDSVINSSLLRSIYSLLCIATTYFNSWYQSIHSFLSLRCHLQCWCHWWQEVETRVALFQILVIIPTWVCLNFFPVLFTSWTVSLEMCVHFICFPCKCFCFDFSSWFHKLWSSGSGNIRG